MTLSPKQVTDSLELFELKPGTQVRMDVLKDMLPDMNAALFFGKLYKLNYKQLSALIRSLFQSTVIDALLNEGDSHSHELQDYIIDIVPDAVLMSAGISPDQFTEPTHHEFLPEMWEMLEVQVADSIQKLIDSLDGVLSTIQGKYGTMLFSTLAKVNKQRQSIIGTYQARIKHPKVPNNLVIFDVSGSVTRATAKKIVNEVVALAYKANASLAIVSNNTYLWDAGTFDADTVMRKAEFGGTQYETLASVFAQDWATVITIADYDSGWSAKPYLRDHCQGRVQRVLDISLVNRPTYLAECVGLLANEVVPLLVGNSERVLGYDPHRW